MTHQTKVFVTLLLISASSPMQQYLSSTYPYKPVFTQDITPNLQLSYNSILTDSWRYMNGISFKRPTDPLDYLLTAIPSSSDGTAVDKT